jgi:hypothetical protein
MGAIVACDGRWQSCMMLAMMRIEADASVLTPAPSVFAAAPPVRCARSVGLGHTSSAPPMRR